MFGPWPIRPVVVGIILAVIYQYATTDTSSAGRLDSFSALASLPFSILRGFAVALPMWIMVAIYRRVSGRMDLSRAAYLIITILTGMYAASIRYGIAQGFEHGNARLYAFYLMRAVVMLLVLQSVLGIADTQLRVSRYQAVKARRQLVEQQRVVLEAEERARRDVASFLHDTVQAGLVAVSLQLRRVAETAPPDIAPQLSSVVEEIEAIRSVDVRSASHLLSPQLAHIGLAPALSELARRYEPAMTTTIDLDVTDEDWSRLRGEPGTHLIAIYRIVEQALLNAAVHGRARTVTVAASSGETGMTLTVTDDGRGFDQAAVKPGTGWTLIDAWVSTLHGSWTYVASPGDTTTMVVRLPFT